MSWRAVGLRPLDIRGWRRTSGAGDPRRYSDRLPVDLLLLCGIFGNVSDADIRATVRAVPSLLAPGGTVIWTRGRREEDDDLRPVVRRWFTEAGLTEVAFDGAPEAFGVGVARRDGSAGDGAHRPRLPVRLFTFLR